MAFAINKQNRKKQVNVRLNNADEQRFREVMTYHHHQTVSDSVRDMIRSGYLEFQKREQTDIDKIMGNIPQETRGDVKPHQLNVRLSPDELSMTDFLIGKMHCSSISDLIRSLINIFHFTVADAQAAVAGQRK